MEYRKFGNTYIMRLEVGEEIMESIKKIAVCEKIALAEINGLGATDDVTIGVRNPNTNQYEPTEYKGRFEIANIHGNITMLNGESFIHIHIGCGNEKGEYRGGHLLKCKISATAEIFITTYEGVVERKLDDKIGINVLKF